MESTANKIGNNPRKEQNMRTTEYGLKITLSELRELLAKAENEVMYANGVGYLYFRNDEVEQPCAYQDCASRYYRANR